MTATATELTPELASRFARLALAHVAREWPNHLFGHVMSGPEHVRAPRELHPVFYGSFDWHSAVHGHWLLLRALRRHPTLPEAAGIRLHMDAHLTPERVAGEVAYLAQPLRATFERPYGWAWLLALDAELRRHDTDDGRRWQRALDPLARAFADRFRGFLPKATYPIRVGTHYNTAFAVRLALDWCDAAGDAALAALLRETAERWYGDDADCQAWEPGGDDFLSSALMEAECMRAVLPPPRWLAWLDRFLPRLAGGEPATLFAPAGVSDRTDGKIAHLDGLNLSRAWCWRAIAAALPLGDPRRERALDAAAVHLAHGLPHVAGDYMGEHWLATFAVLALDGV